VELNSAVPHLMFKASVGRVTPPEQEAKIGSPAGMATLERSAAPQPRAVGTVTVATKQRDGKTVLDRLHQKGSLKLLFPRGHNTALTAVVLNTAGGITGGDRFEVNARAGEHCDLTVTTQAAERVYRAQPAEVGTVQTRLSAAAGARLDWLPQETILYDRSALNRSLSIDLQGDARMLSVEPIILGRMAMGETLHHLAFRDRIDLRRDGKILFADRSALSGSAVAQLSGSATGGGCGAMAAVLFAAPDAERHLAQARAILPETTGISLIRDGVLFARLLSPDGFLLRQALLPLIDLLRPEPLPRTWML